MKVSLIAAITIDGFIARHATDRSFDWTSPEDKTWYVQHLKQSDAVIMGSKTFATIKRYPKDSDWYIYTRKPETFVNPSPERLKATAVNDNPRALINMLEKMGKKQVLICGGSSIYRQFVEANLVDELILTIEPTTFGQGVSLFDKPIEKKWQLAQLEKLSQNTLALKYQKV